LPSIPVLAVGALAVGALLGLLGGWLLAPSDTPPVRTAEPAASREAPEPAFDPAASALVGAPVRIVGPDETVPEPVAPLRSTWERYAAPMPPIDTLSWVAVVIDDLGIDQAATRRTLAMPAPLTLSFLPYGRDLAAHSSAARVNGHEVLIHLPMQPDSNGADPGPEALLMGLPDSEFARRLVQAIDAVPGAVGINNHMGSRLTRDPPSMVQVMTALRARGLMFLDSRTTAESIAMETAIQQRVPALERDVFLDHTDDPESIRLHLATLEQIARRRGSAIAIGHPRANTLAALAEWRKGLAVRGLTLVPLTAVLRKRTAAGG
jgi:polysaccharide deacetylase 2 family uncharacterized protein YibQ